MEDYVIYKQAVKLKELGFDWETDYYYSEYDHSRWRPDEQLYSNCISAPTLAQAQKWLREVKEICVTSDIKIHKGKYKFNWSITLFKEGRSIWDESAIFDTYEQALSAGIDKALELLKE